MFRQKGFQVLVLVPVSGSGSSFWLNRSIGGSASQSDIKNQKRKVKEVGFDCCLSRVSLPLQLL